MAYKIIFTEEQYDLIILTLEETIKDNSDVENVRALIKLLDLFENDYQKVDDKAE